MAEKGFLRIIDWFAPRLSGAKGSVCLASETDNVMYGIPPFDPILLLSSQGVNLNSQPLSRAEDKNHTAGTDPNCASVLASAGSRVKE
jgi:hypothetical protein